jgi:hypothetical protein
LPKTNCVFDSAVAVRVLAATLSSATDICGLSLMSEQIENGVLDRNFASNTTHHFHAALLRHQLSIVLSKATFST